MEAWLGALDPALLPDLAYLFLPVSAGVFGFLALSGQCYFQTCSGLRSDKKETFRFSRGAAKRFQVCAANLHFLSHLV